VGILQFFSNANQMVCNSRTQGVQFTPNGNSRVSQNTIHFFVWTQKISLVGLAKKDKMCYTVVRREKELGGGDVRFR
jgi:hypothetical protein